MSGRISIIIVDDIAETRTNIKKLLSFEEGMTIIGEATNGKEAVVLSKRLRPDIILMDINMPVMDGIQATELISTELPSSSVIIMSVQGEQEYLREAMVAGAREYLVKPFSGDELINGIKRVYERECRRRERKRDDYFQNAASSRRGKVVSVFSTKGGVGKTSIATNLAISMREITKERVLIADLDLQFGDVAVMLDLQPKRSISDIAKEESIDAELIESCIMTHSSGLDVLPSPVRPEQAEIVEARHVERIISLLKEAYDYIIIDTSQSFQDQVLIALDMSDTILLVVTLDIPTIKNVKLCLEVMESLQYPDEKIKVVLNRSSQEIGVKIDELEESIGRKVDSHIPSDGKIVVPSVNTGVPFVIGSPKTKISQSIRRLAEMILNEEKAAGGKPSAHTSTGGLRSRIGRLFRR